jgi:hypothetical protein
VAAVFEAMPAAFRPEAAKGVTAVFQYRISGDGGGDWVRRRRRTTCRVWRAGTNGRPAPSSWRAGFLAMMDGRLPPMQAFTSGKLKIEGDVMKSQLIEKLFKR